MRSAASVGLVILAVTAALAKSPIKSDEKVVFFTTCAYLKDGQWMVPFHGWIFEPEMKSRWRSRLSELLGALATDEVADADRKIFEQRLRWFLVDNERGKRIAIRLGKHRFLTGVSRPNGHFQMTKNVPGLAVPESSKSRAVFVSYCAETRPGDARRFEGKVQLVPPEGVTVVSDIDDTIKKTGVLDRKTMIRNTFYLPFEAVPGMAREYTAWASKGAVFFYLSASPWQLYVPLTEFMDRAGFPSGALRLRSFRLKDIESLTAFLSSSEEYKEKTVLEIMKHYPKRRFILVGDSGEKDPEVYGRIARAHPRRILHIFIRQVPHSDLTDERLARAFDKLPLERWTLFDDPAIMNKLAF